ncbi:MAG: carotenoid biosynthesis protein [Candidatus Paceibacterota bacterium]
MDLLFFQQPLLFFIFEFIGFSSFALILIRELYQKNTLRVWEIISCAIFGLILEIGNTYLAHTYYYSDLFLIKIFNVPLTIGLGWAVIVYCAMLLSDQYDIPWKLRPFLDALTALLLDLSMDIVAIRIGFWHWAIPQGQEWYGVPFENLVGWIFVVLSFSYLVRFLRTLNPKRIFTKIIIILTPLIAYVGLLISLIVFSLIVILPYQVNNWTTLLSFNYQPDFKILFNSEVQLWKIIFFVFLLVQLLNIVFFSILKYRRFCFKKFDIVSFSILSCLHLFFFVSIFISGIFKQYPFFILISGVVFLIHCFLHFLPYLSRPGIIYAFEKTQNSLMQNQKIINKIISKNLK